MKLARSDKGAAALELAFIITLVMLLVVLSAPLIYAFQENVRLERVAGHTARFATSAPDRPRFGSAGRRPTIAEVQAEANRAYLAAGGDTPLSSGSVVVDKDPTATPPGEQITITISRNVDLGIFGQLLRAAGINNSPSIEMVIDAVGRQE